MHGIEEKKFENWRPKTKKTALQQNLSDIFSCYICFGKVRNPVLCPHCSKLCCEDCIKKWIIEQRSQCPHCRAPLRIGQLVNCRFVTEISAALETLKKETLGTEQCQEHDQPLNYYCNTCQKSICSDCAMFGIGHKDHKFEHLEKVYQRQLKQIEEHSEFIKERLVEYHLSMEEIDSSIERIQGAKEDKVNEISLIVDQIMARLDSQLKKKLVVLLSQKEVISDEVEYLESLESDINSEITKSSKSSLVKRTAEIVMALTESEKRPAIPFNAVSITTEFPSEIVPQYEGSVFSIKHFSAKRYASEFIFSSPLTINGLVWKLKVYPNGNGIAKGSYLSIFLHLDQGLNEVSKYEYKIELVNHQNSKLSVIREFASDFITSECWGYNRFFSIDQLFSDGYLSEGEEELLIRFYVRAPTFCQQSRDQKNYIEQLELKIQELENHSVVPPPQKEPPAPMVVKKEEAEKFSGSESSDEEAAPNRSHSSNSLEEFVGDEFGLAKHLESEEHSSSGSNSPHESDEDILSEISNKPIAPLSLSGKNIKIQHSSGEEAQTLEKHSVSMILASNSQARDPLLPKDNNNQSFSGDPSVDWEKEINPD